MNRLYTLIFIACIGFTGFTAQAQISGSDSMAESLMRGERSAADIAEDMKKEAMKSSEAVGQQTSAIKEGEALVVEDVETAEVNKEAAEAIDTKTNRYPPRLKINFSELPLRSLASTSRRSSEAKTQRDIIVQRIQKKLGSPNIDLVVRDRTAIVSGTVSTDHQRIQVAKMLRFEPGIDVVQNEIVVPPIQEASIESPEK